MRSGAKWGGCQSGAGRREANKEDETEQREGEE